MAIDAVRGGVVPGIQEVQQLPEYPESNIYIYVPENYHPDRPIGLFFFMHGGDRDSPIDTPYQSYLAPGNVLHQFIRQFPYITVAPTAPVAVDGKRWNRVGVLQYIDRVLNHVQNQFNIDPDRIILGGHSMGGFGAYHVGALLADRFAGIWCSAGAWLKEDFRAFLGTPVYIAHGKFDCAANYRGTHVTPRHHDWCSVDFARAAHELMLRDDVAHVYDEHPGGHTFAWESTQQSMRRFFQWAVRQKRNPAPSRCAVVMPRGSADPDLEMLNHSRYLTIDATTPGDIELDEIVLTGPNIAWTIEEFEAQNYYLRQVPVAGARLVAENLGDNQFAIEAQNVARFTLFLNSALADCARPVVLQGAAKGREFRPEPSAQYPDYPYAVQVDLG